MHKIVYFIGAGLTKSLEIRSWPVPMMWDFVPTMAHYLDDDTVLATMVDLERADLYEWKSADAARLAGTKFPPDRTAFREALKNRPAESIEDLLEKSLKPSANFSAQGAHQRFKYAINRLFCLVGWNIDWHPLERYLQSQCRLPEAEHTFVSFNYDLVLDRAVQRLASGWGPATGYGVEIPFCVRDDLPLIEKHAGAAVSVPAERFATVSASRLRILEPHGSLNWLVPYQTPYEQPPEGLRFSDGPLIVPVDQEGAIRYWPSVHNFQLVSLPGNLPTPIGVCILSPSSAKRSELSFFKRCREMEHEAIRTADEVIVIGWSVPETDLDQADLIKAAIGNRRRPLKFITVVNRGASTAYFQRVANLFGVDALSMGIHNSGFVDFAAKLRTGDVDS
jgi:hypothetical protein